MLSGSDSGHFKKLKDNLGNDYTKGVGIYPKLTDKVVRLLSTYKTGIRPNQL